MTEPPAAAALLLPATETTGPMLGLLVLVVVLALVFMKSLPHSRLPENGSGRAPCDARPVPQDCADCCPAITAAFAAVSIRSAESYWPGQPSRCLPAAESAPARAARWPARSSCPARCCARC